MVQLQILNKILDTRDSSLITLNGLTSDYFPEYKNEFIFIKEHLDKYNQVPDKSSFLAKFPDFTIITVNESDSYLLEQLYEDYNTRYLANAFNNVKNLIEQNKLSDAMSAFKQSYDGLKSSVSLSTIDITQDTSRYDDYASRIDNFDKYYVKTGFKELDRIIGGWDREEELATIVARTNYGKCLAKGTEVLMADGTIKKVEDVVVGDKVQSLNQVNTVLALHKGVSNGYRIIPNVGKPFVVSSNHILTIAQLKEVWNKERGQMVTNGKFEIKDIMVEDYLKLSNHHKHISKLYRPSIEYNTKEQLIPAYILGSWLGDGTSREVSITSMDDEIVQEWNTYATCNNMYLTEHSLKGKAQLYSVVNKKGKENKISTLFKKYNLFNNKHIPLDYLTGDTNQRLELLAGLIDTDGSIIKGGYAYELTLKSYDLINQVAQLCRGLGFKVNEPKIKHNKVYNRDYYRISITGPINRIPCRVLRKICTKLEHKQMDMIVTGFKVEPVDYVEYYGFMCDGDSRYMLSDNTLTHNTWILLKCATAALEQGLRVGLYSGEMTPRKVGYRFDTLVGHISNGGLNHGNGDIQVQYKRYIEDLPNMFTGSFKILHPTMINGPAGVSALRAFIEKEKLDILFIDQHSLLEDDRHAKTPVERASNISKDLKNLQVMTRIPIISVSQQNRTTSDNGVDTTQIAQSDRIGQDSTVILFLEKKDKELTMTLVKSRDSENGKKLKYLVDLNQGYFTYLPDENEEIDVTDVQNLENRYSQSITDIDQGNVFN